MTDPIFYFMGYYLESVLLQELKINLHFLIDMFFFYEKVNQSQFLKFILRLFKKQVHAFINLLLRVNEF